VTPEQGTLRLSVLGQESIIIGQHITRFIVKDIITSLKSSTYAIITDENIAKLYLPSLMTAFKEELHISSKNARLISIVIPPGESSKSRDVKANLEDSLLKQNCTRDTVIIAFGGGVIGDLVGK